jgi:hypothetical protein
MMSKPELDVLLKKAVASFNSMTLEEQQAILREQAISFVYGQMMDCNPEITREQVREVVNRLRGP